MWASSALRAVVAAWRVLERGLTIPCPEDPTRNGLVCLKMKLGEQVRGLSTLGWTSPHAHKRLANAMGARLVSISCISGVRCANGIPRVRHVVEQRSRPGSVEEAVAESFAERGAAHRERRPASHMNIDWQ